MESVSGGIADTIRSLVPASDGKLRPFLAVFGYAADAFVYNRALSRKCGVS